MLTIKLSDKELFDEKKNEFIDIKGQTIVLEHSLFSLSKWESIWHKPFLTIDNNMSMEELISYIKCMTITQHVDDSTYLAIDNKTVEEIREYIANPMTATTFSDQGGSPSREIITSEVIYGQMVALQIPFECQKWHLNRLLTLIKVCNLRNEPPKKMTMSEVMARNAKLNAERRARLHSKG